MAAWKKLNPAREIGRTRMIDSPLAPHAAAKTAKNCGLGERCRMSMLILYTDKGCRWIFRESHRNARVRHLIQPVSAAADFCLLVPLSIALALLLAIAMYARCIHALWELTRQQSAPTIDGL
jgi:hypothetical protein